MKPAPVVLFVYNRPWHTHQTVEALKKNELAAKSDLFIYADGPKKTEHIDTVQEVREYIRTITGFSSVSIIERNQNFGLAKSIINGVSEVLERFERVIVLEDDMVTSPYFLRFMNEALDIYDKEEKVISIHGYMFPVQGELPETFLLRGADCWGWATWKRGWELFEEDGKKLLKKIQQKQLQSVLDFNGSYGYTRMLKDQIEGKNDSWAIRWQASAIVNNKLTLYPGRSLVRNIGTDESGTHCEYTAVYDTDIATAPVMIGHIPIEENALVLNALERYLHTIRPSFLKKILQRLKLI